MAKDSHTVNDDGLSLRAYCRLVGRRAETVRQHAKLYGLATNGDKIHPISVCMTAHDYFVMNAVLLRKMRAADGDESRAEAERRKVIAQADREELKRGRERGELISRGEADQRRVEIIKWFSDVLERLPTELYSILAPLEKHEIKDAAEAYFDRLRQELVNESQTLSLESRRESNSRPARPVRA